MERKILFRGKQLDNGEWVEGDLVHNEKYCVVIPQKPESAAYMDYLVDPATVGQHTGLHDKNGKPIFEGDIVEGADFTAEDGGYGVVSFDDGAFEVNGNNVTGTFHENYWGKEFEVIGNIHDNPELMKGAY